MRATRRAWAAFLGAVLFGFTYLVWVPVLDSGSLDAIASWGLIAAGAAAGFAVEAAVTRAVQDRRAAAQSQIDQAAAGKILVGS